MSNKICVFHMKIINHSSLGVSLDMLEFQSDNQREKYKLIKFYFEV